jgi:hypothetical protein
MRANAKGTHGQGDIPGVTRNAWVLARSFVDWEVDAVAFKFTGSHFNAANLCPLNKVCPEGISVTTGPMLGLV